MMDESIEDGEIQESEDMSSVDQFSLARVTREPQRICSDESSDNSDNSDDDSDTCSKPKKVKPLPPPPSRPEVPNKYKVWSIALQEEALMENLNKCDVEAIERDERNVESYNYKLHLVENTERPDHRCMERPDDHYYEEMVKCEEDSRYIVGSKRRHGDIKKRLGKKKEHKIHSRRLPNLSVTAEDAVEDVAEDIALKLKEPKVDLICKIVLVLGKQKAIDLYNETKDVEDNGGMLLMNGERRRTSGGVYLLLLKRDSNITSQQSKEIFADDIQIQVKKKRKATKRRLKKKFYDIKETLIREKLLNLNTAVGVQSSEQSQPVAEQSNNLEEGEVELSVSNPPPSPATDQDTPPSQANAFSEDETEPVRRPSEGRPVVTYEDDDNDYLDIDVDEMDVF